MSRLMRTKLGMVGAIFFQLSKAKEDRVEAYISYGRPSQLPVWGNIGGGGGGGGGGG